MKLKKITGRAKKCGPSALSAITGLPTHDCAKYIRFHTSKRSVNGVHPKDMIQVLQDLNFTCIETRKYAKTLRKFADWVKWLNCEDRIFLVIASNHYVVFDHENVADSGFWFGRKPVKIEHIFNEKNHFDLMRIKQIFVITEA